MARSCGTEASKDADSLAEQVRRHREAWPLARIAQDRAGFQAALALLLEKIVSGTALPDACWLNLMFGGEADRIR
jgi:hypothetical protein